MAGSGQLPLVSLFQMTSAYKQTATDCHQHGFKKPSKKAESKTQKAQGHLFLTDLLHAQRFGEQNRWVGRGQ